MSLLSTMFVLWMIEPLSPGITDDRAVGTQCHQAYEALWDWDVNQETLDDFSRRLSPETGQPSIDDCVKDDVRWEPWTRYDNLVTLFDTMRTWKRCATQLGGYESWEQCRDDDRGACTNPEFERRLAVFGLESPGQCEDILPACDRLTEARPVGQDQCWMHYDRLQKKCGQERIDEWKSHGCWTVDATHNPHHQVTGRVISMAVVTGFAGAVCLSLGAATIGLLSSQRPHKGRDRGRHAARTITTLLSGQPIHF